MEWDFIWKAILIVIAGTFLLRIAGRKTISQMTLAETVIMVAIGSLLIQPVAGRNVWMTIAVGAVLVTTLIVIEYLQVKSDFLEKLVTGKSKILIENGNVNEKNLKKLRMTVDQLEMQLRQNNVTKLSDIQWATLEPNGQVGFSLNEDAQPVTKKEFQQLLQALSMSNAQVAQLTQQLNQLRQINSQSNQKDMFAEVKYKEHQRTPPKHLQ
ncbi:DUF421 domain-containing protein [Bacillus fonticola]|uniref:DUF421 domain-containing protein n=1 Tax=Bacillus fonticola TaxID=2728853 RepID=UPI0014734C64|nr:DUF421 domain-containing protein [Bacillus fonticola]